MGMREEIYRHTTRSTRHNALNKKKARQNWMKNINSVYL